MTLQEFERRRLGVEREKFRGDFGDPINFGIERGAFEKKRLQRLIDLGKGVRSKTVQAKVARWKRQLQRVDVSIDRLEKLRGELAESRLHLDLPPARTPVLLTRPRFE